jgi:hypothetical protein
VFGIPLFDLAWLVVALLAAGAITGLLASVFGVGGGAVAVPILYELFRILEAGRGAHAALRRHLPCHHHPNLHPLLQCP